MSTEKPNIDQLVNLTKGEIIIFRLNDPKDKERIEEIKEEIKIQCEENELNEPSILFIDKYESIINLSERDMNSFGWEKKKKSPANSVIARNGVMG